MWFCLALFTLSVPAHAMSYWSSPKYGFSIAGNPGASTTDTIGQSPGSDAKVKNGGKIGHGLLGMPPDWRANSTIAEYGDRWYTQLGPDPCKVPANCNCTFIPAFVKATASCQ